MKKIKLSRSEKAIEQALLRGEYRPVKEAEFKRIAGAVARRKKDAAPTKPGEERPSTSQRQRRASRR